jgi:hypothetical protein
MGPTLSPRQYYLSILSHVSRDQVGQVGQEASPPATSWATRELNGFGGLRPSSRGRSRRTQPVPEKTG